MFLRIKLFEIIRRFSLFSQILFIFCIYTGISGTSASRHSLLPVFALRKLPASVSSPTIQSQVHWCFVNKHVSKCHPMCYLIKPCSVSFSYSLRGDADKVAQPGMIKPKIRTFATRAESHTPIGKKLVWYWRTYKPIGGQPKTAMASYARQWKNSNYSQTKFTAKRNAESDLDKPALSSHRRKAKGSTSYLLTYFKHNNIVVKYRPIN